jgi:hypothetical protein
VTDPLPEGIYESLRTLGLNEALAELVQLQPQFAPVDPADVPHVLARHIAVAVERALTNAKDPDRQIALVNDLLHRVAAQDEQLAESIEQLVVLSREVAPGVHRLERPVTPLSAAALLTNAPEEQGSGKVAFQQASSRLTGRSGLRA